MSVRGQRFKSDIPGVAGPLRDELRRLQQDWTVTLRRVGTVPASATARGAPGEFASDATHVYFCAAPNVWVRCALDPW